MSTVHDLRAKFSPSHERNAALWGARSAFPGAKPQPATNTPATASPNFTIPKNTGAAAAASLADRRNFKPLRETKPITSTNAAFAALLAHNKSQDSLPFTGLDSSKLSPQTADLSTGPRTTRATSPSNVAAALAAARSAPPRSSTSIKSAIRPSVSTTHRDVFNTISEKSSRDELSSSGTVGDVKRWLQSLEDLTNSGETLNPNTPSMPDKQRTEVKPQLRTRIKTNTSSKTLRQQNIEQATSVQVKTSAPRILSPQPIRIPSAAASLEESTIGDLGGIQSYRQRELLRKANASESQKRETNDSNVISIAESPQNLVKNSDKVNSGITNKLRESPIDLRSVSGAKEQPTPIKSVTTTPLQQDPLPPPLTHSISVDELEGHKTLQSNESVSQPRTSLDEPDRPFVRGRRPYSLYDPGSLHVSSRGSTMPISRHSSQEFSMRRVTPHMTGDSLANAIVASSLASSRAPSPTKSPAPSTSSRINEKPRAPFQRLKKKGEDSRTPSPTKSSHFTLRKKKSADESSFVIPKHHKKFFHKHPHKHHEGDRKRWRDTISEAERKRYEGVWAANKGLYIEPPLNTTNTIKGRSQDSQQCVTNIVVRDIWKRSRLPFFILAEVWDLVDRSSTGRLDREEFVVGLWLIDQRLKGRKLPIKVSDSVWGSVRGVQGIKIPKPKS